MAFICLMTDIQMPELIQEDGPDLKIFDYDIVRAAKERDAILVAEAEEKERKKAAEKK